MIFGKFALDGSGVVRATVETPSATGIVNGAAYLDDEQGDSYACVSTAAVNAADGFIGGFRYTTAGALRVSDVTAGIPASNSINQGILMTDNGQVCFSGAAGTAVINGVSVTADGAVSMQVMAFLAEFEDDGAGAVDTAVTFGNVAATFTRATTATTVSRTGLIISVATGVARSYYDPTSLAYLGYLAEGARTNLCIQSAALDNTTSAWSAPTRASVSADAAVAPDGTSTADKLVEDSSAATTHFLSQAFTKAASAISYSVSIFAKAGERTWIALRGVDGIAGSATAYFDLSSGAVGTTQTGGDYTAVSSSIKAYPNGWYRCVLSYTTTTDTADSLIIFIAEANLDITFSGDGTSGVYLWGAQKEAATFSSSYIPTTTATVTRNADLLTYPTTGWLNAAAGTMFSEHKSPNDVALNKYVFTISDGTGNESISIVQPTSTVRGLVTDGGVQQAFVNGGTIAAQATAQSAFAYVVNDFAISLNGGAVATDTSGTIPTISEVHVGYDGGGTQHLFGPIRRVAYYPSRLPNATLQSLTA